MAGCGKVDRVRLYKCTDGIRGVDDQFQHNRQGCTGAGLPHAPYHYYQPSLDPQAQAEHFIDVAGKDYRRYIVDVEATERVQGITRQLKAFLDRVQQLTATRPAIYTSAGYWNEFIQPRPDWAAEYDLVVAHYTTAHQPLLPVGWTTWRIWQFSDYWDFSGCEEQADADWFNGSLEKCRAWFGNAKEPEPPPGLPARLRMRSLFDDLRIRQTPDMNAKVTGMLARGEIVEVEQMGGNDAWVRHARGWSCCERGGYRYMELVE